MARIRSIKPELRESRIVRTWPFEVRYFWVLFWGYLDDYGRGNDMPKRIAGDCFPDDDITAEDIDKWLQLMTHGIDGNHGPVCRYEVAGRRYVHAVNWSEHQRPNRPTPSRIPKCPLHEGLTEPLHETSVNGAAEQQSRGAVEQQQPRSESLMQTQTPPGAEAAVRLIVDATGVTHDIAAEVVLAIARERKPRNLAGLIRSLIKDDDLGEWISRASNAIDAHTNSEAISRARASPPCEHGEPGGNQLHPLSHKPFCPICRAGANR